MTGTPPRLVWWGEKAAPRLTERETTFCGQAVSEASQTTPAMVFARQKFGATLQSMAPQQTQRFTTAPSVVRRSGSSAGRYLFSSTRSAAQRLEMAPTISHRCASDLRSRWMRDRSRAARRSQRQAGSDPLTLRQGSCEILALKLNPARDGRTRGSCWQVWRPGSVAAR